MDHNKRTNDPPPYQDFTPATYYQPPPTPQNFHQPLYPNAATLQPPQPSQQSTVIIQTATRPSFVPISSTSCRITCPSCHAEVLTTVKHVPTTRTHCWAIILCLLICWPCVCLPYCMDSCQDAAHYCPNCNAYIGTYTG